MTKRRNKSKRRYVQAARIELTRDTKTGVLVAMTGDDLGANHSVREERGEVVVRAREVSRGGTVVARGAEVVSPGRMEALVVSGALDGLHPSRPEARRMAIEAAEWVRDLTERRRLRKRVVALYQPATPQGQNDVSKAEERAAADMSRAGAAVGWPQLWAMIDAITFEEPLSRRSEELVIEGISRLVIWLKMS
jgi:hypothetical protein